MPLLHNSEPRRALHRYRSRQDFYFCRVAREVRHDLYASAGDRQAGDRSSCQDCRAASLRDDRAPGSRNRAQARTPHRADQSCSRSGAESLMSGPVVTLGAHVLDILGRYVTHIPEGQGSVLLDEIRLAPAGSAAGARAGSGAGTAVGLAKLGLAVATVGAVGDDALGDVLIRALNGFGVDTSHVIRKPGVQTSASILPIRPNGDRPALHAIGANAVY